MTTPTIEELRKDITRATTELARRQAAQEMAEANREELLKEIADLKQEPETMEAEAKRIRQDVSLALGSVFTEIKAIRKEQGIV